MRPLTTSDRAWPVLSRLMRGHARIYRATGGRIGRKVPGLPQIQIGRRRIQVHAIEATDAERQRLWPPLVEHNPVYERYVELTDREFPVVILRPTS